MIFSMFKYDISKYRVDLHACSVCTIDGICICRAINNQRLTGILEIRKMRSTNMVIKVC